MAFEESECSCFPWRGEIIGIPKRAWSSFFLSSFLIQKVELEEWVDGCEAPVEHFSKWFYGSQVSFKISWEDKKWLLSEKTVWCFVVSQMAIRPVQTWRGKMFTYCYMEKANCETVYTIREQCCERHTHGRTQKWISLLGCHHKVLDGAASIAILEATDLRSRGQQGRFSWGLWCVL